MDIQAAFERVERDRDYLIDILQKIIQVDTTVPPGINYGRLIDVVEPEYRRLGFETRRVYVPEEKFNQISDDLSGERPNLVASMKNGKPKVSAYAHMDVVPAEGEWAYDPFGGQVVEGKLYGRGTVDMKGSIACFLGALKVLNEMGIEPCFEIDCLLCTDEETGIYPGARYLAEEGYFSNHLAWLELSTVEPIFCLGATGAARATIKAFGRSCHSGMNYLGINAIEQMVPILNELMALKAEVETRLSRIPAMPAPGAPYDKMSPMFNLNIIKGGSKDNIVPAECTLTINRRYIVEERFDDMAAEIEAAVKKGREKSKLLDVTIDIRNLYPPVEIDPETAAARKARAAKRAVSGADQFIYGGIGGSTDLGFVAEILKDQPLEVANFGLIRADNMLAHAADEFVYIDDLVSMTKELVYYFGFEG